MSENPERQNVLQQLNAFYSGEYDLPDWSTQCKAGWYDWFCKDTSLVNKTKSLYPKVQSIIQANYKGKRFNPADVYVFFKNNCPMNGRLYDSFSFVDINTGNVVFWITPSCGHKVDLGEAQVCGPENGFDEPLAKGRWKDIVEYFKGGKKG